MRYCGTVGYIQTVETTPGVWEEVLTEHTYFGDTITNRSRWENSSNLNDNINISNQLSIVADAYAYENFQHIKYAEFMGAKWKVVTAEVQRPRLLLTLGGVYNGE